MKESWIIPCNVKVFDVVEHFKSSDTICWKRGAGEKNGDTVYVYIGIPYKAIMYRCIVIDDHVSEEEMKEHTYATKGNLGAGYRYMKLQKEKEFKEPVDLATIKALGVYMVRKQSRVDRKVLDYLNNKEQAEEEA